mgnify:CR=1 FL=1
MELVAAGAKVTPFPAEVIAAMRAKTQIVLDRKVSDKRVFPAIDVARSGTRKDELLLPKDQLRKGHLLRRILNPMGTMDAIEFLIDKLKSTKTNQDFFGSMNQ